MTMYSDIMFCVSMQKVDRSEDKAMKGKAGYSTVHTEERG